MRASRSIAARLSRPGRGQDGECRPASCNAVARGQISHEIRDVRVRQGGMMFDRPHLGGFGQ
jgi:hypothetical protein